MVFLALLLLQSTTNLSLDLSKPGLAVSPTLYGLMTEEINYSYDGGLYGELVRNRAFLDDSHRPVSWVAVGEGASAELERSGPSAARPVALRVHGGVANSGYWGIPVRPATTYRLSLWAKSEGETPIDASVESTDGSTIFARTSVHGVTGAWRHLTAILKTSREVQPTTTARLVLRAAPDRTVWFSQVSLFPPTYNNRSNGNRSDLMNLLIDMHPKFLRFPGGNYVEGNTPDEKFPWKATLGAIEDRPGHRSPWGYRSTDGMGLLEFLRWCEEMKAKPVLAVYAGYALNGQVVKAGPELQPLVQDAVDEIEYVIGGPNTKWGAERAKEGHPKPFPLECVEIGNEDGFDKSGSYEGRFLQFYDAIKTKFPQLQVISTTNDKDWSDRRDAVTQRRPDLIDDHYYSEKWDMMGLATRYDGYDRKGPKVFVGEWASHDEVAPWTNSSINGPTPDLNCAVADAAFLTGLERNSDVVRMACYAPLLVNVNPGGRQWAINLIGYDGLSSFGSPSYYAQCMFAQNIGDRTVPVTLSGVPMQTQGNRTLPGLFVSATRDSKTGALFIKLVNALSTPQDVDVDFAGGSVEKDGTMTILTGDPKAVNTLAEPKKVVPVTTKVNDFGKEFRKTLPAHSVTVLRVQITR